MQQPPQTIGLLHHIGGGNLGDDATQAAVMLNIRRRWPHVALIAFSANPDDTRTRHGTPSYAIRRKRWTLGVQAGPIDPTPKKNIKSVLRKHRVLFGLLRALHRVCFKGPRELLAEIVFLASSFRVLKRVDLLIVNGGGQLTELGGSWGFPYTIWKWSRLARLAHVKCLFLNVGAGPLTRPLSTFFVKRALSSASYASFRDEASRALVRDLGFKGPSAVFLDSAYSLELPAARGASPRRAPGKPIVGLAPMPYCDPRVVGGNDQQRYVSFIRKLGLFASWLGKNDCRIALFGSDIGTDPLAIEDLRRSLIADSHIAGCLDCVIEDPVHSVEQLLNSMAAMDYVVTCRFHGVIFAHLLNKPVLAIAHHPKVTTLMSDLGLARYCVDIDSFQPDLLITTWTALVRDSDEIKERMTQRLARYRLELTKQFDDLFPQVA